MEKYLNDLLKKLSASVDGDATKKRIKQALDDLTSNVTKGVQIIGAQLEQKKASAASAATIGGTAVTHPGFSLIPRDVHSRIRLNVEA